MGTDKGFKITPRCFFDSDIWLDPSPFDVRSAWQDLIRRAQWSPTDSLKNYGDVKLDRGELITSFLGLARYWRWSRGKVKRFIEKLEKQGRIRTRRVMVTDSKTVSKRTQDGHSFLVVTICKYDEYQNLSNYITDERTVNGHKRESKAKATRTHTKQTKDNKEDIYKVFEFWNSMQMHHHLKITDEIESHVGARIDDFGVETVCEAIKNYERILHSDNFWLTYKWTLVDFTKSMNRFETFLTYNRPFHKYLNTKKMSEAQLEAALQTQAGRTRSPYDDAEPESVADLARKSLGLDGGK